MISDDDDADGVDGILTVSFGLQIENGKGILSNFENICWPIIIYFDALAMEGEGGGCGVGGSFSTVSQGQTLQAVPDVSNVVSSCFVGSLNRTEKEEIGKHKKFVQIVSS
jgi:hypothetical protein